MTDKREPSFEADNGNGNGTVPAEAAARPAAIPAPQPSPPRPAPPKAGRTPPEDPAQFQRWIEIEKLKVELKRLELEQQHLQTATEPPSHLLGYVTLALIAAIAGLLIYVVMTLVPLREEVARLRTAQLAAPTATTEAAPAASPQIAQAPAAEPPAADASPGPQATDTTPNSDPAATPPAPATAEAPAPEPAAAEPAPPPAVTYTVRIFATASIDKAKLERFANVAKAAGFNVDVSAAEVFQPLRNALSYHPGVGDAANRLARALQAKYPGINLDSKASPSITDIAKNVLILNIMDDAVN
ncbi:hypothetical protein LGR54_16370 [Ancylobacter sp. Lp-2]|uniref:hypothetical protein n=1 Tax=Ancylobacter sp. Lp-2 TaxID=2881339 RepID=UPI001E2F0993|nr:hypothetical protein [Ancylobacter sp. Lp-2]MCB4770192.1 hypothetical protein [Ancylobacter sp. Lp-2]